MVMRNCPEALNIGNGISLTLSPEMDVVLFTRTLLILWLEES